jgi:4-hydroxy-3-methylbut-2-en-1-yl diphosphate reductase
MAFFIQSEANIISRSGVEHYVYIGGGTGRTENRPLWPQDSAPKRVLITGGASCPDGIIQQVITRINSFFPPQSLRSLDEVLAGLTVSEAASR